MTASMHELYYLRGFIATTRWPDKASAFVVIDAVTLNTCISTYSTELAMIYSGCLQDYASEVHSSHRTLVSVRMPSQALNVGLKGDRLGRQA